MSMRSQRKHEKEFKFNAVNPCQESRETQEESAKNLGIPKATLYTWIKEYQKNREKSFQGSGTIKPCNEELYLLRKELADVKQERDILKKAVAIFSKAKN